MGLCSVGDQSKLSVFASTDALCSILLSCAAGSLRQLSAVQDATRACQEFLSSHTFESDLFNFPLTLVRG